MKLYGIDLSHNNGKPDFEKIKKSGIDFVMLRAGFGSDIPNQDDLEFERSVRECERLDIKWGAYLYSYALTVEQAKSEAKHMLRLLKGKTPDFPIAFDMEDADGYKLKHGLPTNDELVEICYTFLDEVESHGYYVVLYANKSWLENPLKSNRLDRFDKWVAQWGDKCTYEKPYHLWQYSNHGKINGVNGRVDMDIAYTDFNFKHHKSTEDYKVQSGDNLTKIADEFHTTIQTLLKLNPKIDNKNLIIAGDIITVPKK